MMIMERCKVQMWLLPALLLLFVSCKRTDPNAERGEYIRVYDSAASEVPLDRAWVSVNGGTVTYYVRSNVPFSAKWQSSDDTWASIGQPKDLGGGLWSIDLTAKPVWTRTLRTVDGVPTGTYTRRYGVLMLTCQEKFLGKYFVVEQGFENRIACDFSWLHGSLEPNATYNDMPMSRWTVAQLNRGFTSTIIDGEPEAWVFSKEGYLKLGNDHGAGADLITPRTADFQYDTLLVVSFKAVAQSGAVLPDFNGGTEPIVPMRKIAPRSDAPAEGNLLKVEVTGGGCIRDAVGERGTSISFQLPSYDSSSPSFPADMFSSGAFLVFIEGTQSNPITVNTAIRFVAGEMKGSDDGVCNRVFLDDVFVYRIDQLLDEDLFGLNGGKSGKDIICGGK